VFEYQRNVNICIVGLVPFLNSAEKMESPQEAQAALKKIAASV